MKYTRQILLFFLLSAACPSFSQHAEKRVNEIPSSFCVSPMEFKLYTMINEYRARYDLPPIPLSKSLCYVAALHVKDLFLNHPDKGPCNAHSWSANGHWKPFCYPRDENKKNSVWDKPRELTTYKGKGYEIVYWENNATVIDSIIELWKSVDYFNSFLMNTGKWNGKKWNAIGISIYENYAAAWFGELPDEELAPVVCGSAPVASLKKEPVVKKEPAPAITPVVVPPKSAETPPAAHKQVATNADTTKIQKHKKTENTQIQPEIFKKPSGRYYIVVKSQSPRAEMIKSLDDLKSQGYPEAKLLERDRKLRVSVLDFQVKAAADSALREVRKTMKDAWILKF